MHDLLLYLSTGSMLAITILVLGAFVILISGLFGFSRFSNPLMLGFLLLAMVVAFSNSTAAPTAPIEWPMAGELITGDAFVSLFSVLVLGSAFFMFLLSGRYWQWSGLYQFELPVIFLLSLAGLLSLISANHFITVYLGLELSSLCFYFLASFHRNNLRASEAGLKYYILGSVASAVFLFGVSLIYGVFGVLDFTSIIQAMANMDEDLVLPLMVGLIFVMVGLGFKMAAVPFHMWAPDVYDGVPTPITAFFITAPKIASVAILAKLLLLVFLPLQNHWQIVVQFLGVMSLLIGGYGALTQQRFKRFLAYAGILHVGFLLLSISTVSLSGLVALANYIIIYVIQSIGLFAMLLGVERLSIQKSKKSDEYEDRELHLSDLAGLASYRPILSFGLLLLLFSLVGVPPLLGFFAKWWVVVALVSVKSYVAAVIAVVISLVASTYYLKIIKLMYIDEPDKDIRVVNRTIMVSGKTGQVKNLMIGFWFFIAAVGQLLLVPFLGYMLDWLNQYLSGMM